MFLTPTMNTPDPAAGPPPQKEHTCSSTAALVTTALRYKQPVLSRLVAEPAEVELDPVAVDDHEDAGALGSVAIR